MMPLLLLPGIKMHVAAIKEKLAACSGFGRAVVATLTLGQLAQGQRKFPGLMSIISKVYPKLGLLIHGKGIDQLDQMSCEQMIIFLLLGREAQDGEVEWLQGELQQRSGEMPKYLKKLLQAMPEEATPMYILSVMMSAVGGTSSERKSAEAEGRLSDESKLEIDFFDMLNVLAWLPRFVAAIYLKRKGRHVKWLKCDFRKGYGENLATLMGVSYGDNLDTDQGTRDPKGLLARVLTLHLVLHCIHGTGNASAHTFDTIKRTHADTWAALSGGCGALSGARHGGAAPTVLAQFEKLLGSLGVVDGFSDIGGMHRVVTGDREELTQKIREFFAAVVDKGLLFGWGHGAMEIADPRGKSFAKFARENVADHPLLQIVEIATEVIPPILEEKKPRMTNKNFNVDWWSGVTLIMCGFKDPGMAGVMFMLSRSFGMCAESVLAHHDSNPLFRPGTFTPDELVERIEKAAEEVSRAIAGVLEAGSGRTEIYPQVFKVVRQNGLDAEKVIASLRDALGADAPRDLRNTVEEAFEAVAA